MTRVARVDLLKQHQLTRVVRPESFWYSSGLIEVTAGHGRSST
jgi:hypothetical protein